MFIILYYLAYAIDIGGISEKYEEYEEYEESYGFFQWAVEYVLVNICIGDI